MLINLALKSTLNRKGSVLLTLFTIAISVMLLLTIERVRQDAKTSFSNTISGTDLIVGARTGDIQLLLSSVFRIGHANNSVSWSSYQDISTRKGVAWRIPISLGDSHKGFAVLGTDDNYFTYFRYGNKESLAFTKGRPFHNGKEVVIGSDVAKTLHYHLGEQIIVSHGMGNTSFHHHDDTPLTIVGILAPTGTPVDKTVHVPLVAIDAMHGSPHSAPSSHTGFIQKPRQSHQHDAPHNHSDVHDDHEGHHHSHEHHQSDPHGDHKVHEHAHSVNKHIDIHGEPGDLVGNPKQITAFLLGLESPLYMLQLRRNINVYKAEPMLAIMPTLTLRSLWEMLDIIEKVLLLFSFVVVLVALLGMLTSLLSTLNQRRREMAILRSVGARPWHIFTLLISEAIIITLLGCLVGIALFYLTLLASAPLLQAEFGIALSIQLLTQYELLLVGLILGAGTLMGMLPALRAYYFSLADGMSIKV